MATLVELLDARTAFTAAGLNRIVTTYDYWTRRVELERAAALYALPPATDTR
jgi:outer membrane protein TolC